MASNLDSFNRRTEIIADNIGENASKLTRKTALAVDQTVVVATPVDSGRAKSNWIAGLNAAPEGEREPYSPGSGGSTSGENTLAAIDQAEAVISSYTYGDEIHITNNLTYIQKLNDGWSKQAPANFVEQAVEAGVAVVKAGRIVDGSGTH